MLSAFICGGNWNNGVHCGGRTVNLNNYPWNVNTNIGSRLACDLLKIGCFGTLQIRSFTENRTAIDI
jgi:hypothetical protein